MSLYLKTALFYAPLVAKVLMHCDVGVGMGVGIFLQVKQQTQHLHDQLEQSVDIFNQLAHIDHYRSVLEIFYGFYQPLENKLTMVDGVELLEFHTRLKVPHLRSDLQALGLQGESIDQLQTCNELPAIHSLAGALGCWYVVEGATLGGQIISKQLAKLGITIDHGGAFFNAYGTNTATMWLNFKNIVEQRVNTQENENIFIDSAQETFVKLIHWFRLKNDD